MANLSFLRTGIWLCCALIAAAAQSAKATESEYQKMPGPLAVKSVTLDWKDADRDRTVPVRIYYPDTRQGTFPVIIFSHGLGGSRDGYGYLGQCWASFGYVSVHLQHIGSDSSVWQGVSQDEVMASLKKSLAKTENVLNRPLDVSFAIDQLEKLNKDDELFKGRLDLDHIGMAGHSFGAFTTMAVVGEVFATRAGTTFGKADPRIKAAIAMSASAPKDPKQYDMAFAKITVPILHMTGTLDESPVNESKPADRRVPFDHMSSAADQYLITLQGGDHMVFSGRTGGGLLAGKGDRTKDAMFHAEILQSTTAFWDAYLKSDAKAKTWLADGGCKTMFGENAVVEVKPKR